MYHPTAAHDQFGWVELSLARPDVPGERERLVTIARWTTPECWRDRKLIITHKRGVTVKLRRQERKRSLERLAARD